MEKPIRSQNTYMKERWQRLWSDLGATGDPNPIFDKLAEAYSSGRAYHNLSHIEFCVKELDKARDIVENPRAVEFALWFHDVVYDSKAKDNEEKSAEWARKAAIEGGLGERFAGTVYSMIMATKHKEIPQDNDTRVLADIDLAILGQPKLIFDEYDRNIRKEYSFVPAEDYRVGRMDILNRFKARKSVFSTPFFSSLYNKTAKRNLEEAVQRLELRQ